MTAAKRQVVVAPETVAIVNPYDSSLAGCVETTGPDEIDALLARAREGAARARAASASAGKHSGNGGTADRRATRRVRAHYRVRGGQDDQASAQGGIALRQYAEAVG